MQLAAGRRQFLIDETRKEAELETLLESMCDEIDRQRTMIRALAYGAVATALVFFVIGMLVA